MSVWDKPEVQQEFGLSPKEVQFHKALDEVIERGRRHTLGSTLWVQSNLLDYDIPAEEVRDVLNTIEAVNYIE